MRKIMMSLLSELNKKLDNKKDRMIEIRRYLHEHPELSFEENETAKYIEEFYDDVAVDNIETNVSDQLGIIVTLMGKKKAKQ